MSKSTSAFHLCRDFQRCEVPLRHFCSDLTPKDLKFRLSYLRSVRTSKDLVCLPHLFCQDFQVWVSPLQHFISAGNFQRFEVAFPHFCAAFTAKDLVPLSVLPLGQDSKDLVHLPRLFCQDFQIWISPLPHFIFARTSQDLNFRFHTSALPWPPKMWSSASSVPP